MLKVKKEHIESMNKYLIDLDYPNKVKRIIALRKILEINPDNIELKRELIDLEYDIKIANARCSVLSNLELTVISYRYFKLDDNNKRYSYDAIGRITGYSKSSIPRIINRALSELAHICFTDTLDILDI